MTDVEDSVCGQLSEKAKKEQSQPEDTDTEAVDVHAVNEGRRYFHGAHLLIAGIGASLALFLPSLEFSVVSTSLIAISTDLDGYGQSSWIITAYLVTYTGFLIPWAKLSDLLGVRPTLLGALFIFVAFSGGCGAAQSMAELIICRAFQGMGGSGVYSLTLVALVQMVPQSKYDRLTALGSIVMALGLVLGPLVGGAINVHEKWRWIFLLNLPVGAVAFVLIWVAIPPYFPYHCDPTKHHRGLYALLFRDKSFFRRVDVFGALLVLSASLLLVAALEEGGVQFAWRSSVVISLLAVSGVVWLIFFTWEWLVSRQDSTVEPMFPWRFFGNRVWMGVLCGSFLSGAPITIAVIEIPQRFQIVNSCTPLQAGVRLLAYAATQPVGTIMCAAAAGRFQVPFVYLLMVGATLQTVGFALLSVIPTTVDLWMGQFGYICLAGIGTGASVGSMYIMAPTVVDERDQPVAIGTVVQMRMLGGALGIAVVNSVLNNYVKSKLSTFLTASELDAILQSVQSIVSYPVSIRDAIRVVYAEAFNLQMKVTVAFSAAQFLVIFLLWKRKNVRLEKRPQPD